MLHHKDTGKDQTIYDDPEHEHGIGERPDRNVPGERLIAHEHDTQSPKVKSIIESLQQAGKNVKVRRTLEGIVLIITSAVVVEEAIRRGRKKKKEKEPSAKAPRRTRKKKT